MIGVRAMKKLKERSIMKKNILFHLLANCIIVSLILLYGCGNIYENSSEVTTSDANDNSPLSVETVNATAEDPANIHMVPFFGVKMLEASEHVIDKMGKKPDKTLEIDDITYELIYSNCSYEDISGDIRYSFINNKLMSIHFDVTDTSVPMRNHHSAYDSVSSKYVEIIGSENDLKTDGYSSWDFDDLSVIVAYKSIGLTNINHFRVIIESNNTDEGSLESHYTEKESQYRRAKTWYEINSFKESREIFLELGDYADSKQMVDRINNDIYVQVKDLINKDEYEQALDMSSLIDEPNEWDKYNQTLALFTESKPSNNSKGYSAEELSPGYYISKEDRFYPLLPEISERFYLSSNSGTVFISAQNVTDDFLPVIQKGEKIAYKGERIEDSIRISKALFFGYAYDALFCSKYYIRISTGEKIAKPTFFNGEEMTPDEFRDKWESLGKEAHNAYYNYDNSNADQGTILLSNDMDENITIASLDGSTEAKKETLSPDIWVAGFVDKGYSIGKDMDNSFTEYIERQNTMDGYIYYSIPEYYEPGLYEIDFEPGVFSYNKPCLIWIQ